MFFGPSYIILSHLCVSWVDEEEAAATGGEVTDISFAVPKSGSLRRSGAVRTDDAHNTDFVLSVSMMHEHPSTCTSSRLRAHVN